MERSVSLNDLNDFQCHKNLVALPPSYFLDYSLQERLVNILLRGICGNGGRNVGCIFHFTTGGQ